MSKSVLMTLGVVLVLGLMALVAPANAAVDGVNEIEYAVDGVDDIEYAVDGASEIEAALIVVAIIVDAEEPIPDAALVGVVIIAGLGEVSTKDTGSGAYGDSVDAALGRAMGFAMSDPVANAAVANLHSTVSGQVSIVSIAADDGTVTLSWFGWEQTCPPNMYCILGGFWHFVNVVVDMNSGEVVSVQTDGRLIQLDDGTVAMDLGPVKAGPHSIGVHFDSQKVSTHWVADVAILDPMDFTEGWTK